MNILLISVKSECSKGGIAVWTERFLANCEENGILCELVNTEMIGKRGKKGTAKRNFFDELKRTRRIFRDLNTNLKNSDFDAVHLNTSCGTFGLFRDYLIAKQIKKKNLRLVTHFHCDIPYWIHNPISKRCLGKLVNITDVNFVLCENSKAYLENEFKVESRKIPNFIDDSLIRTDEKIISDTINTALFVGRIEEAKGAKELYALANHFPSVQFRLIGDVSDSVALWNKSENIVLLGGKPHDEILKEMDEADIFVFPSHSEGFSLALTEAMARGLPCIATDVGANADMLDGGCGLIAPIGDVDVMQKSICFLNDKTVRYRKSVECRRKVKEQYTTKSVIERLKECYSNS